MHLKMSSGKWGPLWLGLNVLMPVVNTFHTEASCNFMLPQYRYLKTIHVRMTGWLFFNTISTPYDIYRHCSNSQMQLFSRFCRRLLQNPCKQNNSYLLCCIAIDFFSSCPNRTCILTTVNRVWWSKMNWLYHLYTDLLLQCKQDISMVSGLGLLIII